VAKTQTFADSDITNAAIADAVITDPEIGAVTPWAFDWFTPGLHLMAAAIPDG
jgi:hypothetical protein